MTLTEHVTQERNRIRLALSAAAIDVLNGNAFELVYMARTLAPLVGEIVDLAYSVSDLEGESLKKATTLQADGAADEQTDPETTVDP